MASTRSERPRPGTYPEYTIAYISKVPDGDIVATMRDNLESLSGLYGNLPEAKAAYRYAPGKWSVKEVLGHVVDTERVFAYRALRVARGDATPLPGFDENRFAAAAGHDARPMRAIVDEYRHVRLATLDLFESFDAAAWSREGRASDNPISVTALAWLICGHELHHAGVVKAKYV